MGFGKVNQEMLNKFNEIIAALNAQNAIFKYYRSINQLIKVLLAIKN